MNVPQAFGILVPLIAETWALPLVILENKIRSLERGPSTVPNFSSELKDYLFFARLHLKTQVALRDQLEACIRTGFTSRQGLFSKINEVLRRGSFMFSEAQRADLEQDEQESLRLFQCAHDEALEALKSLNGLIEEVNVCIKKAEALQ